MQGVYGIMSANDRCRFLSEFVGLFLGMSYLPSTVFFTAKPTEIFFLNRKTDFIFHDRLLK